MVRRAEAVGMATVRASEAWLSPRSPGRRQCSERAHWETRGPQKVGRWSHSVWLTPVAQFKLVVSNAGDDAMFVAV